jgi:hypothetical protein
MKRLDLALAVVTLALAAFVGAEARDVHRAGRHEMLGAGSVDTASGSLTASLFRSDRHRDERRMRRDPAEVQRRIREGESGTYIGDVLLARDSSIARWRDRRARPLRVWVQSATWIADFDTANVRIVRQAFSDWAATGIPVQFAHVADSAAADVHVTWVDRFDDRISGKTLWSHDDDWWIVDANIQLAVHHHSGDRLDGAAVRAISLHEVGHLIGLDHTPDTANIMTPKVRVRDLSDADRATARLLYTLPPGSVR